MIHRRFAAAAARLGLSTAECFLDLPGEVVSGHRDRHVVAVTIGRRRAYFKKEHRVSFGTRLRNWREGAGWTSLSEREANNLDMLKATGIPVPEWLAYGTSADGRSFVLLRKVRGSVSLANALSPGALNALARWQLARNLGTAIARLHRAGFTAPDLSQKHVLVRLCDRRVVLLDWPRAQRRRPNQLHALKSLAALHASLPLEFADIRERLLVLKTFLRTLGFHCRAAPLAREITRLAMGESKRRSIAEQLNAKQRSAQRIRWIDGERLCVTRPLWASLGGKVPDWLRDVVHRRVIRRTAKWVELPRLGRSWLFEFPPATRWRRWGSFVLSKPIQSAAIKQASLAFRLQRHRIPVCSVLAFGGRADGGGILLVKALTQSQSLKDWSTLRLRGRRRLTVRLGRLMRQCNESGCRLIDVDSLLVTHHQSRPKLRLVPDGSLMHVRRITTRQAGKDLKSIAKQLNLNSRDVIHLMRGYVKKSKTRSKQLTARTLDRTIRRAA